MSVVSNGVLCAPLATICDNCRRNTPVYRLSERGRRSARDVCSACIAANSGRIGWPYADDLIEAA